MKEAIFVVITDFGSEGITSGKTLPEWKNLSLLKSNKCRTATYDIQLVFHVSNTLFQMEEFSLGTIG